MTGAPHLLQKLIFRKGASGRLWTALGALCTGITLLLAAVLIWWNFNQLLHGRQDGDSLGSTFLTVSKRVSNENMGHPAMTVFSPAEVAALQAAPGVERVGNLLAVQEQVNMKLQLGEGMGFSTLIFLEAVPDAFVDKLPPDWRWQPGSTRVPIILSSEFLSLYNYVFAPGQHLPQLSEESIQALPFQIEIGRDGRQETFTAHIAGFSDRIASVLVPQAFAQYANRQGSTAPGPPPSRLVLKVSDPSDQGFNDYLTAHDYVTNTEQLRWSRLRAVVQVIAGATGVLAILLMGISLLVFTLFIELTIARARQSVQLLLELGYSPAVLSAFLYRRFLPLLCGAVAAAVLLAALAQAGAVLYGRKTGLVLSFVPGWPVWATVAACLVLLILQLRRAVSKALAI